MKRKTFTAAVLAVVLACAPAVSVCADPAAGQSAAKTDIEKIASIQKSINSLEAQKKSLLGEDGSLNARIIPILADITEIDTQLQDIEADLKETQEKLQSAQEQKSDQYEAMKKRIQSIYEQSGTLGWGMMILNADDLSEVLDNAQYTEAVYNYDRKQMEEYSATVTDIRELQEKQEDAKQDLESLKSDQADERASLDSALAELRSSSSDYDADLASLTEKSRQYRSLVEAQNNEIAKMADSSVNPERLSTGSAIIAYASSFIGNRYVFGGNSLTNGTDCSGFVNLVYAHFGYSVPRQSAAFRSVGRGVSSLAEAQPGDIICYSGHVGLYIGNNQIVNASNSKPYPAGGIKISDANMKRIVAIRRVV